MSITIITVCFNSVSTIKRTFDSVLSQTLLPDEYIVKDGLSTDGTIDIIKEYEPLFKKKGVSFIILSEKDTGIYSAMNAGAFKATSQWLHFLNSDDYYLNNNSLQAVAYYLNGTSADVVYGNLIKGDLYHQKEMTGIRADKLKLNMRFTCPLQQPCAFIKRELFHLGYYFDEGYKISGDYKFFVQVIQDNNVCQHIPVYVTFFDEGGISSLQKNSKTKEEDIRVLEECGISTWIYKLKYYSLLYKPLILLFQVLSKL